MSDEKNEPVEDQEVDPTFDPTEGHLEATEFPEDDVPDPEQTAEDLGAEDGDEDEEEEEV